MTMGLKSRILIGGMVKAKIMYYYFFFFKVFLDLVVEDRCVCLGEAGSWV